jgi:ferredoxin-NADP reductase
MCKPAEHNNGNSLRIGGYISKQPLTTERELTVTDIIQRTHDIKSFRFAFDNTVDFKAGQYMALTLTVNGKAMTKYFSFSNSPTERGYIELTKRLTESDFSKALNTLKAGDSSHIQLPFGNFTFEGEHDKIALLSAGIGITPIRSICKYVCDMQLPTDIVLIFGNRTENDIVFLDDFNQMEKENRNLRVVYTLSKPINTNTWTGKTGRINADIIMEEIPDFHTRTFYVCGPPKMVESSISLLADTFHVSKNAIKYEQFTGYNGG